MPYWKKCVFKKEELAFTELDDLPLKKITGHVFYNTSKWTLKSLYQTASNTPQYMLANFEEYLDGFSTNIHEIINCFKLREQIRHMSHKKCFAERVGKICIALYQSYP